MSKYPSTPPETSGHLSPLNTRSTLEKIYKNNKLKR